MKTSTILYTFSMLFTSGLMLTACSSDDTAVEQTAAKIEAGKTYYMKVNTKEGNTRALSTDGTATWATTERIYVRAENGGENWFGGFLQPETDGTEVNMSGRITIPSGISSLPTPAYLDLRFPRTTIDYTDQDGTLSSIAAKHDYATGTVEVTVTGDDLNGVSTVAFNNLQAIVEFTLKYENGNPFIPASLRISATDLKQTEYAKTGEYETGDITILPKSESDTNVIYAALSGISQSRITLTAEEKSTGNIYLFTKQGSAPNYITFEDGHFYKIPVTMRPLTYPIALADVTNRYIGSLVGANGYVYPNAAAATAAGTNAVAMIAHVGYLEFERQDKNIEVICNNGLAIALADESEGAPLRVDGAQTSISQKTKVPGGTWKLPHSKAWRAMFISCGGDGVVSSDPANKTVNYTCFNAKLATAGGTSFRRGTYYWDYWEGEDPENDPGAQVFFGDVRANPIAGYSLDASKARAVLAF